MASNVTDDAKPRRPVGRAHDPDGVQKAALFAWQLLRWAHTDHVRTERRPPKALRADQNRQGDCWELLTDGPPARWMVGLRSALLGFGLTREPADTDSVVFRVDPSTGAQCMLTGTCLT